MLLLQVLVVVLLLLLLFASGYALIFPSLPCGKQQQHHRVTIANSRLLAQVQSEVDAQDDDGCTKLFHACRAGDVARVEELLAMNASPDLVNNRGSSPLSVACANGKEDVVKMLLSVSSASVNLKDRSGFTPLFAATNNGHANVLRVLLDTKTTSDDQPSLPPHLLFEQLDAVDDEGWSCLFYATYKRRYECMRLLLVAAAASDNTLSTIINKQTQTDKWTCAWYASFSGYDEALQILLETNKVDVTLPDANGRTCLQIAEEKGRDACVALLRGYMARRI